MQGVTQARNEEFSLSSGDFPTLGSEKDKSVKNSEFLGRIFCTIFMVITHLNCIAIFFFGGKEAIFFLF